MTNLTYRDITLDTATIPEASLQALLQRGFNHEMGNVVSSRVVGEIRKAINSDDPASVTTEAIKAWRESNQDKIAELEGKFRAESLDAIKQGQLGVRASTGSVRVVDPLQAEMRKLAKTAIEAVLKAAGLKFPTKDKTLTLKGVAYTGEQLIARRLDSEGSHRAGLEAEAKRVLAARKREVDKHAQGGLESLIQ